MSIIVLALLFVVTSRTRNEDWMLLLVGAALGFTLVGAITAAHDKHQGTLELLCTLPVSPGLVAAAKLAAAALATLPAALGTGGALALLAHRATGLPVQLPLLLAGTWIGLTVTSCTLLALAASVELEAMAGVPATALAILGLVLPALAEHWMPHPLQSLRWLFDQPWAPLVITVAGALLCCLVTTVAWMRTRSAIARYAPSRAR